MNHHCHKCSFWSAIGTVLFVAYFVGTFLHWLGL